MKSILSVALVFSFAISSLARVGEVEVGKETNNKVTHVVLKNEKGEAICIQKVGTETILLPSFLKASRKDVKTPLAYESTPDCSDDQLESIAEMADVAQWGVNVAGPPVAVVVGLVICGGSFTVGGVYTAGNKLVTDREYQDTFDTTINGTANFAAGTAVGIGAASFPGTTAGIAATGGAGFLAYTCGMLGGVAGWMGMDYLLE